MIFENNMVVEMENAPNANSKTFSENQIPPRVWLVDDSNEFRELLSTMLAKDSGLDCSRQFCCASDALAALKQEAPPDIVLLDIQMGPECGLDAIQPIKTLSPATQVVMLTTCFDSISRRTAQQRGAVDFLLKSFSVEQIANRVWQAFKQVVPSAVSV